MNTVQERVAHWRRKVKGLSLRAFREMINRELPGGEAVSLGTVANYERRPAPGQSKAGPRASFVAAMKRAFPELRLAWLLMGEGEPTELAERVAGGGGLEGAEAGLAPGSLAARVLARYPDLELLSPEASGLFTGALARYATGEPGLELTEEQLMELAGDLRWLLLLPLSQWGFDRRPDYERFSAYSVALLHALSLAMPGPAGGDPISTYPASLVRRLRASSPVGLGE